MKALVRRGPMGAVAAAVVVAACAAVRTAGVQARAADVRMVAAQAPAAQAQAPQTSAAATAADARLKGYDALLDLYVRDGFVYYRALKSERARLDAYVASLADKRIDAAPRSEQIAFWINAYNAFVLQTVVNNYPIARRSQQYPARSVRQIPGAFERQAHRAAGRSVTLDQIEQSILPAFHDPRVFLALGRGAVGSSRLRSEAYEGADLERQLAGQAGECLRHAQCVSVDATANRLRASSIFSWREQDFVQAYADKSAAAFAMRSPIERAVLAFIDPEVTASEREFLARNQFTLEYIPFDWTLNDLNGR